MSSLSLSSSRPSSPPSHHPTTAIPQRKKFVDLLKKCCHSVLKMVPGYHQRKLIKLLNKMEKPMPLSAGCLTLKEVQKIFGLKRDPRCNFWEIDSDAIISVPQSLYDRLSRLSAALGGHPTRMPACRMRLDAIVIECVSGENHRASQQPCNTSFEEERVLFTCQSQLKLEVVFRRQRRILTARSDYSIWYDNEGMGTNFVIVQARNLGEYAEVIPQCMAYMAMVHKIQKAEGRKNIAVYGCCSDSYQFALLRIDDRSRYSQWVSQGWSLYPAHSSDQIWTHLCHILRMATASLQNALQHSSENGSVMKVQKGVDTSKVIPRYKLKIGRFEDDEEVTGISDSEEEEEEE